MAVLRWVNKYRLCALIPNNLRYVSVLPSEVPLKSRKITSLQMCRQNCSYRQEMLLTELGISMHKGLLAVFHRLT